jgi:hypothetical protein
MKPYEQTIFQVLREIASQRTPGLPALEKRHTLTYDLGLRSLDLAQLVATLEIELRADPFARLVPITSVRTVGDVCDAYGLCFEAPAGAASAEPGREDGTRFPARAHSELSAVAELRRQARGANRKGG